MEKPNIVYGRLTEAVHISGYTLERAIGEFKYLLDENRWKEVGPGYDNINDFIKSINFRELKLSIEQRKEIVQKLAELEASQRATAKMLGVTQPTIMRDINETNVSPEQKTDIEYEEVIEDNETNVSLSSRVPESTQNLWFEKEHQKVVERERKIIHVSNNSGENEWYTPVEIIESARAVMGSIDLDPATSLLANETVKAEQIFTKEDNGLINSWSGNVWMNPPYSQPLIKEFSDKLVAELSKIDQACVLTNNATETEWYQQMMQRCKVVCFVRSRVKFIDCNGDPSGAPLQGQTIMYFGKKEQEFVEEFGKYGICLSVIHI